jgi:hypothetical protein
MWVKQKTKRKIIAENKRSRVRRGIIVRVPRVEVFNKWVLCKKFFIKNLKKFFKVFASQLELKRLLWFQSVTHAHGINRKH